MTNEDYDKQKLDELRDMFAACAMMGLLGRDGSFRLFEIPAAAYIVADSMIEERKKYLTPTQSDQT